MGCGGSSTFNEDGSIQAGKGEAKLEWDKTQPVEVGFYYHTEANAEIMVKEFPMDKECAEKVFNKDMNVRSSGGMHWVKVVPGNRYGMKYLEGGHSVAFPGQKTLGICQKIHAFHTKDDGAKDNLVKDLKKDVEKVDNHPYKADGADDKIKADIDGLGGKQNCSQFPDEMTNFKKACVTAEDMQPWNTIDAKSDISIEYGHWDLEGEKLNRVMGLADKAKAMAEEKMKEKGPEIPYKAVSTAQKVFKGVVEKAVEGALKKAGPEVKDAAPDLAHRIDNQDHCCPTVARVEERKLPEGAPAPEKKEEGGDEDPLVKAGKASWEADKGSIDQWKNEDKQDYKGEVESYLKSQFGKLNNTADPSSCDNQTMIMGEVQGFAYPMFVEGVEGEEVKVTNAKTLCQDESTFKIAKQTTAHAISGSAATEEKRDAFYKMPDADASWVIRGAFVYVRNGREVAHGYVKEEDGDNVVVEDGLKVERKVKKSDCFTHLAKQHLATHGIALIPNFAPITFWWVQNEDPNVTVFKVRVWRLGARDETLQEVDLVAKKAKAKPSETNKEPTHEVHIGYCATVPLLCGEKYAYNFLVGDKTMVDWEKPTSDKGFKVATVNARVEY